MATAIALTVLASGVLAGTRSASADSIDTASLFFDGHNTFYRSPFGAIPTGSSVTVRLRVAHQGATAATAYLIDLSAASPTQTPVPMSLDTAAGTAQHDFWKATMTPTSVGIWGYYFQVQNGTAQAWYGDFVQPRLALGLGAAGKALTASPTVNQLYLISVYQKGFKVPSWLKKAVMYQIFPDRFFNGDKPNDSKVMNPAYTYKATIISDWNAPEPTTDNYNQENYYGGDLQGIIDKLPYLKGLGVNVLYLNPIFQAGTNHGYDTADYKLIAPHFGTLKTFKTLIAKAHKDHIKVILDGVFNHTASDSIYFNRYGHFPNIGAYQSQSSPYYGWYTFQKWPNVYSSYFGIGTLPQLNESDVVKNFIFRDANSVAQYWLKQGADGWRLDHAAGKSATWWQEFRTTLKPKFPNDALICECDYSGIYLGASNLLGNMFDGDMNYPFQLAVISFFAQGPGGYNNLPFSATQFLDAEVHVTELIPRPAAYGSMNVIGTHDTCRALSLVKDSIPEMKQMAAFQMAWLGMPEIYYGDEAGLDGCGSPDTVKRRPFPWSHQNTGLEKFYKKIIALRERNAALVDGSVTPVSADDTNRVVAFLRKDSRQTIPVVINDGSAAQNVSVPTAGIKKGTRLVDGISGKTYTVTGSTLSIHVAATTTAIVVPQAKK
jgi:glycosidase